MDADLDGTAVGVGAPFDIEAGQVLRLGTVVGAGVRTYVAVRGGIDVPEYLGSRATFVLGRSSRSVGVRLIASTTSMPATTRPKAGCLLSRRLLSTTLMKN